MKTTKYRKKCFDQIDGIVATNKDLTVEVDRLRKGLKLPSRKDQCSSPKMPTSSSSSVKRSGKGQVSDCLVNPGTDKCCCLSIVTSCTAGVEAEVTRLREENARVVGECGCLTEDNKKLVQDHAQLRDHMTKMTEELKSKFSERLCSFLLPP